MSNFKVLAPTLDKVESMIDSLSAEQMHNAMVNIDRIAPCFGKGWTEFRTWHFEPFEGKGMLNVYDPCTKEQLTAFVANKRAMLAAHPYVAA